jgi:hypothetical protein
MAMGGAAGFLWLRLRHDRKSADEAYSVLVEEWVPRLSRHGAGIWGAFAGHFGLDSRELLLIVSYPDRHAEAPAAFTGLLPTGFFVTYSLVLRATARPNGTAPLERQGLYVHRLFETDSRAVDEIVSLSTEAWESFESSDRYQSRPMGLFREHRGGAGIRMLLVTWYGNFADWEESRSAPPAAAGNFRRRAELTRGTVAIATRLLARQTD